MSQIIFSAPSAPAPQHWNVEILSHVDMLSAVCVTVLSLSNEVIYPI